MMTAGSPGRVKRPLLWLMAAGLVLIVYGAAVEPYWIDEVHQVGVVPGLPGAWEGARVAVIGDLQVGMWRANVSTIRRVIDRVVKARPDLLLIAGDFVYEPTGEETVEEARDELEADDYREIRDQMFLVVELLLPLSEAGIPIYAVLGNHDYANSIRAAGRACLMPGAPDPRRGGPRPG